MTFEEATWEEQVKKYLSHEWLHQRQPYVETVLQREDMEKSASAVSIYDTTKAGDERVHMSSSFVLPYPGTFKENAKVTILFVRQISFAMSL